MVEQEFIFIRHGKTDWGISQGHKDLPLNEEGKMQAHQIYDVIKQKMHIQNQNTLLIYTSPLTRAKETATIFSSNMNPIPKIHQIDDLRERFYGSDDAAPETTKSFQQRVREIFDEILTQPHNENIALIFSHQQVFEYLTEWLTGAPLKLDFCDAAYFTHDETGYKVSIIPRL